MMKSHILNLDKPRELRYGFKALRLIRQKFGDRSIENMMNMPIDEVPVFAWAGMKWEDKTLTIEQVEDMLDEVIPKKFTVMHVVETIITAMADQIGIERKKASAGETKKTETKPEVVKTAEKTAEKTAPVGTTVSSKKQKKQP